MLLVAFACGPAQPEPANPTEPTTTEPTATDPTTTDPGTTEPPAGDARAELLALLTANRDVDPTEWPEEMELAIHPGGSDALVGMTRDELVGALGEPTVGEPFTTDGQLAWSIGNVPEERLAHAPILIVTIDETGTATQAVYQLSQ